MKYTGFISIILLSLVLLGCLPTVVKPIENIPITEHSNLTILYVEDKTGNNVNNTPFQPGNIEFGVMEDGKVKQTLWLDTLKYRRAMGRIYIFDMPPGTYCILRALIRPKRAKRDFFDGNLRFSDFTEAQFIIDRSAVGRNPFVIKEAQLNTWGKLRAEKIKGIRVTLNKAADFNLEEEKKLYLDAFRKDNQWARFFISQQEIQEAVKRKEPDIPGIVRSEKELHNSANNFLLIGGAFDKDSNSFGLEYERRFANTFSSGLLYEQQTGDYDHFHEIGINLKKFFPYSKVGCHGFMLYGQLTTIRGGASDVSFTGFSREAGIGYRLFRGFWIQASLGALYREFHVNGPIEIEDDRKTLPVFKLTGGFAF